MRILYEENYDEEGDYTAITILSGFIFYESIGDISRTSVFGFPFYSKVGSVISILGVAWENSQGRGL